MVQGDAGLQAALGLAPGAPAVQPGVFGYRDAQQIASRDSDHLRRLADTDVLTG